MTNQPSFKHRLINSLWNAWCCISIVGIWPRFIEPNLIVTTKLKLPISNLPSPLHHLKVVQFSDLHLNPKVSDSFIDKLCSKIQALKPDLIVFTGDLLCFSRLDEAERLKKLLCRFHAPHGCYAIFGNHDYASFVSITAEGEYDTITAPPSNIWRGLKRLARSTVLTGKVSEKARQIPEHEALCNLLKQTPFVLLDNHSKKISIGDAFLNICGVGEYMLGRCNPKEAFKNYDSRYPGIVLAHNPDSISLLKDFPGDIILSGHTHGGQINLPWFWHKLTLMENMDLVRGFLSKYGKKIYVNRGIGSIMPFRWFAIPEILELTLEQTHDV